MTELTDWLTAIGTCGAVVTSLFLAGKDSRAKRKEDERRQAEQVTAWFVPYEGEQDSPNKLYDGLRIKNASNQIVYDLVAQVVSIQGSFRKTAIGDTEERNTEFGANVGQIPPGDYFTRINNGGGGMHRRFWIELAFQDAAGRFWVREGTGLLRRVKKHPIDLYNIGQPVSWEN
jgi:hypothetical protein